MKYEERHHATPQTPEYDCLVFDLDDTLYPLSSGLAEECRKNIGEYMAEKLGIEESKVPELCTLLYARYGTTMAGLRAIGYAFDYDDYHSFVHGRLPLERLKPDPVLRHLLLSLPIRKVIFSNGDKLHVARVLSRLGLEDCFEGIICFETLNSPCNDKTSDNVFDVVEYLAKAGSDEGIELPKSPIICKPSESAMEHALKIGDVDPKKTVFFDDSVRNIQAGKRIGLHTVLVGTPHRVKGADHALESLHNIREALPALWEEAEKSEELRYSGKVAIETQVRA